MLNAFRRMGQGVLSVLGEDAFFDGSTTPVKINIENGVQVQNDGDQNSVVERDVATMSADLNPRQGKTFVQNGKTYRLEFRIQDSGVNQRFVILDVTP